MFLHGDVLSCPVHFDENVLLCPTCRCRGTYLHQTKVEVHSRVAPDADGVVVSVSEGETRARPLSLSHSTMGDRDDVRIEFGCEFCGRLLWLEFKQHKGQTLVSWRDQGELWDGRCGGGW